MIIDFQTSSNIVKKDDVGNKFYNLFLLKRDIKPSILEMLHYLTGIFDLYYVTSRIKSNWNVTKYWFKRNKIPQRENLYLNEGEKLPVILKNEIDVFVEDRVMHILELKNHTKVILVRQPWNEEIWDEVTTIDSVLQVPEVLGV